MSSARSRQAQIRSTPGLVWRMFGSDIPAGIGTLFSANATQSAIPGVNAQVMECDYIRSLLLLEWKGYRNVVAGNVKHATHSGEDCWYWIRTG